jgi:hypothetical protein
MMFDVATKTTDIIMFNSRNLGALIADGPPVGANNVCNSPN